MSAAGRRQPVPSLLPLTMSSKQASMISSGPPCPFALPSPPWPSAASPASVAPKPSHTAGPAQVTAPAFFISASCTTVKSLKPTKRVPRSMARAMALYGICSRMRVSP